MTSLESSSSTSAVSWGAVLAGGVASAAVSLLLVAVGTGTGLAVVSPWTNEGVSATTAAWAAGVFLLAIAMISSTVGGFIAGRLRHAWTDTHRDEVYFRDSAHGFLVWAFATLLTAGLLGSATTNLLSGVSNGAIQAASSATAHNPADVYVDRLLRPAGAPSSTETPAATRTELARLIGPSVRSGTDVSNDDRAYAARVISARAGIPQAEAEKRISDAVVQAKAAADAARKTAMKLALWLAVSMLAGAIAAALGAIEGGVYRDGKWYEPGWSRKSSVSRVTP